MQEKTLDALKRMTDHGPDVCIEAVGALPTAVSAVDETLGDDIAASVFDSADKHCECSSAVHLKWQCSAVAWRFDVQRSFLGAGFHYCKTMLSRIQMMLKLETDPSEILNELIYSCRKVSLLLTTACVQVMVIASPRLLCHARGYQISMLHMLGR